MCKRLLILSCSARKSDARFAPALERYQSPVYFLVRRYLRLHPENNLVIWILSAKYGLISSSKEIEHYDQCLTPQRAAELKEKLRWQFVGLSKNLY